MKNIRYLSQFLLAVISFCIFKVIGIKLSSYISGKIFQLIGPSFRSKKIIHSNIRRAMPKVSSNELKNIRTGRVSPDILKTIIVDSYGSKTPLTQLSNINNLFYFWDR